MNLKFYTQKIYKFFVLLFLLIKSTCFTSYAQDELLPSGIKVNELEQKINEYIEENKQTTCALAYAVFGENKDICVGYYGYADKENKIFVDEETVFEWGSASKLMVWISVMQLAEQGKINLNANITDYLGQKKVKNIKKNITMIDLMNHCAGFQEHYTDIFVKDKNAYSCLEDALLTHTPKQVFDVKNFVAYSNWSTALASYIVEQVSGMSYVNYVHKNIFVPLGMKHSAIDKDLSDNEWVLKKRKEIKSYDSLGNKIEDAFFYIPLYPVGMCTSTLNDFKTFAQSLMNKNTVLFKNAKTWHEFFTPTDYYANTSIERNCHGMWMLPFASKTIGHGGNTAGFSSYLLMDIKNGIASVVMTNQCNEKIYNIEMNKLIYGKYSDEKYNIDKGVPKGIYKSARTFKAGPLKILNLSYHGDLNEKDVFFVYDKNLKKIEYPYLDYYKISLLEMIFEISILSIFILSFAICLIILTVHAIKNIFKMLKKRILQKNNACFCLLFITQLIILAFLAYAYLCISNYAMASTYQFAFVLVAFLTLVLCFLFVYGCYKTVTTKACTKAYRFLNSLLLVNSFFGILNILYWNLFMFWAL